MARPPGRTNYTKLVHQAHRTKSKVKQNKIEAYRAWQKKLGRKSPKLDKIDDQLRKIHKELKSMEQKREEDKKAMQRFLRMLEGAYKELKTYKQVPVPGDFPQPPPKNAIAVGSILAVVVPMLVYLSALKAYMAMAEALSKEDA